MCETDDHSCEKPFYIHCQIPLALPKLVGLLFDSSPTVHAGKLQTSDTWNMCIATSLATTSAVGMHVIPRSLLWVVSKMVSPQPFAVVCTSAHTVHALLMQAVGVGHCSAHVPIPRVAHASCCHPQHARRLSSAPMPIGLGLVRS